MDGHQWIAIWWWGVWWYVKICALRVFSFYLRFYKCCSLKGCCYTYKWNICKLYYGSMVLLFCEAGCRCLHVYSMLLHEPVRDVSPIKQVFANSIKPQSDLQGFLKDQIFLLVYISWKLNLACFFLILQTPTFISVVANS